MPVNYIPEGLQPVIPYLIVQDASRLIDFLKNTFGAEEVARHLGENGKIRHAEVKIGGSAIMLGDATEQWKAQPVSLYVYVPDTDATYKRALQHGGKSLSEPVDQFYGDRNATITDPVGNTWFIGTHVEDVSNEELERRMKQMAHRAA